MKVAMFLATLVMALLGQQGAMAAGDQHIVSNLKNLLQEVKALRIQIKRLESRIERLEQSGNNDFRELPRHAPKLPGDRPSVLEWRQHEMPWLPQTLEHDRGLYVFPGLDTPTFNHKSATKRKVSGNDG